MYRNVGLTIKTIAQTVCIIGIAVSLVLAVVFYRNQIENIQNATKDVYEKTRDIAILKSMLIVILGVFTSYFGCIILAGFGELVNDTHIIAEMSIEISESLEKNNEKFNATKKDKRSADENCDTIVSKT